MSNMSLKNAWYGLIGRDISTVKPKDPRANHDFSDEDREYSADMRKIRQETKLLKEKMQLMQQKRELEELKDELYGQENEGGDDDEQTQILQYLTPILASIGNKGGAPSKSPPTMQNTPSQTPQTLSDDDIRAFIVKQPRSIIKLAKTMPKELVKRKVLCEIPMTDEEFERAHAILLSEH